MDYISSPNLFTISSCNLNTKFNGRCYSDWSKTNFISVVTQEGIYILQPHLECVDEPFAIDLIRNPKDKFRHTPFEKSNLSLEDIWNSLDSRQYIETFLDPALLTNVIKLSGDCYPRRFRCAKWSPVIDTFPAQCLLTTITVDYQLIVFARKDEVWVPLENLSFLYDELWMQTIFANNMSDASFEGMRRNLHSLSFNALCWKECHTNNPFLLTATLTGDIAVWSLNLTASNCDPRSYHKDRVNFNVAHVISTNQEQITSMQLHNNILITTSRNGQVNLYDLSIIIDKLNSHKNGQQVNTAENSGMLAITQVQPTAILWHQDNIEVMDFYLQPLTPDTFRIVLTKSTNICWCTIHYKPKTEVAPAILAISDSFSAINGLDPEVSLHQTPATWLKSAGRSKAVLIADDGSFFQLDFTDDRHDTSPSFSSIRTGKIDLTDMSPRGLCTSPNGVLITMISCVTFLIDPLKIPAPTKLITLPTMNERKFFIECMQNLLDENWLISNNVQSPMDVCDLIDCIRSMVPQMNHYQFDRLRMMLKEEIAQLGYPKTSTQLVMLKILGFLLLKLESIDPLKIPDYGLNLDDVCDVILLESIAKIVNSFILEGSRCSMNEHQIRSLRNIFGWLEITTAGNQLRDRCLGSYEHIMERHKGVEHEMCSICQSDIAFVSHKFGTCLNNHKFDRCSRSLLIVDLTKEDAIQCRDCKRRYLARLVWPSESLWLCLYCQ